MAQGEASKACANAQQLTAAQLGRSTALPNWIAGKVTPNQLAVLWALQLHAPDSRPSVQRIADVAGVYRATVLKILSELEERGWVKRSPRVNELGGRLPSDYEILIWTVEAQAEHHAVTPLTSEA